MPILPSILQVQRQDFISLWVQSLLLGLYSVVFAGSLHLLFTRRHTDSGPKSLLAVTVLLFVLSATQVALNFTLVLISSFSVGGMLDNGTGSPDGLSASVINLNNVLATVGIFLVVANNVVADCLLTWRCYIIWGRRRLIIAFPVLLIVAGTVAGFVQGGYYIKGYLLYVATSAAPGDPSPAVLEEVAAISQLQNDLGEVFYSMTFACNVLMTALIAFRVLWVSKDINKSAPAIDSNLYRKIIALFIESGGVHSLFLLLSTATGFSSSTGLAEAFTIVSSIAVITAGLSPTLIIVMLALGKTAEQTSMAKTTIAFAAPAPLAPSVDSFSNSFQRGGNGDEGMGDSVLHFVEAPPVPEKALPVNQP